MVNFVLGMEGTGAGDDLVAPGQRLPVNLLHQEPGSGTVFIPEDHVPVCHGPYGAPVENRPLGRDSRQQPDLFAAGAVFTGHQPGTEPLYILAGLLKVGTAGLGPAAVQQQTAGRSNIPGGTAAEGGVAGEKSSDFLPVRMESLHRNGVVETHHDLIGPWRQRLHGVGGCGIQDGGLLVAEDHPVQAIGVTGAMDALDRPLGELGQLFHHGGLAAARAAFDQIELHARLLAQFPKIAVEPGRRCGSKEKIDGLRMICFHSRTPRFWHKVCKSEAECHKSRAKIRDRCAGKAPRSYPAGPQNPQKRPVCSGAGGAEPPDGRSP